MQECRYARYRPARDVPVKTKPTRPHEQDTIGRRTDGSSLVPIRILIPPLTSLGARCVLLSPSSAAIAMQSQAGHAGHAQPHFLDRINWLFLILASQLKSSTLGRVPPYILVKHTRESNRSPPALRSVIWVLIGPATLSFRPQESKKVGHLIIVFLCGLWRFQSLLGWGWRILKNLVRPSQLLEI